MRNKQFLLWMTKPTIRARDARRGLNIIADELQQTAVQEGKQLSRSQALSQARNQFGIGVNGELGLASMTIREALSRESRAIGISIPSAGVIDSETRTNIGESVNKLRGVTSPMIESITETAQTGASDASNVLRQIEQNKLLGVSATQ
jgi:hypothetical protein